MWDSVVKIKILIQMLHVEITRNEGIYIFTLKIYKLNMKQKYKTNAWVL